MYILGLTTLGDSAASLIKDGELVAAVEEERFSRKKHHAGFPYRAIQFCLDQAGIELKDVEHVGHYWKPWILRHKAMQAAKSAFISTDMFKARADRGKCFRPQGECGSADEQGNRKPGHRRLVQRLRPPLTVGRQHEDEHK